MRKQYQIKMYANFITVLTALAVVASALPTDGQNTKQLHRRDPSDQSGNSRFIYQACQLLPQRVDLGRPFWKEC